MLASKIAMAAAGLGGTLGYVEDVFSTYLYTGNGSTQTITNGIDLAGEGGLVWIKDRGSPATHGLYDSARGSTARLDTTSANAQSIYADSITSFNASGFSIGARADLNTSSNTYASWTFRKAEKFFDVVTFTGNGVAGRTVAHNLGSTPAVIIVKSTDGTGQNWRVYHSALGNSAYLNLNTSDAVLTSTPIWNNTSPTDSVFSLSGDGYNVNDNGFNYVAYVLASDAGGFGAGGSESIIKCGSFDGAANTEVNLGFEPQWIMFKNTTSASNWQIVDSMRGMPVGSDDRQLMANLSNAESDNGLTTITATGFTWLPSAGSNTYIYIAIRRPMKVPGSGTEVLGLSARSGTDANATVSGGQIADAVLIKNRGATVGDLFAARLTGTGYMETSSTAAEVAAGTTILQANPWDVMDGVKVGTTSTITNASGNTFINYLFRRAPGFMDVVCYDGTGSAHAETHNLGVAPELWIVKNRDATDAWQVGATVGIDETDYLVLNTTAAFVDDATRWNDTAPTATQFTVGTAVEVNTSAESYVAYLFATLAGISKVGTYTGTAADLNLDMGFAAGARFFLCKRTDSTGDWYVYDSERGIVAGNDPYLLLNSTAAEVTGTDYVDPLAAGLTLTAAGSATINISSATYIYLATA